MVYFPLILLIFILQWHTGVNEETFDVNSTKIAQTTQNIWNFIVTKSTLQEIAKFGAIIREISYSNLETGRYGPKSGDSLIIRESWQHWVTFLTLFYGYTNMHVVTKQVYLDKLRSTCNVNLNMGMEQFGHF